MPGKKKTKDSMYAEKIKIIEDTYNMASFFHKPTSLKTTGIPNAYSTYQRPAPIKKKTTKKKASDSSVQYSSNYGAILSGTSTVTPAGWCRDPNCNACKDMARQRKEKEEQANLPRYYSGLRITVAGEPHNRAATVIGLPDRELPKGHIAVCFDTPVSSGLSEPALEEFAGRHHGMFISTDIVTPLEDQATYGAIKDIPSHIGVVVIEDTKVDTVPFVVGQTGRVVTRSSPNREARLLINWYFPNKSFYAAARNVAGAPKSLSSCYNVPREMVTYCRLDGNYNVVAIWPGSEQQMAKKVTFQKGEYLRTICAEPEIVFNTLRKFRLSPGTIVRYDGRVDTYKSQVTLAGGCDPAILGIQTILGTRGLEKLEGEFIDAGVEVEITATISFRKQDLRGKRAIVVLPLDQDEEVGLQFEEDIGAGSLDGYGQDKRCLYIHREALKKTSG